VEHLERAPAGAVAGDRVGGQELRVRIAGEVDAGVAAVVQVGELEAVDGRQAAFIEGEGGRGGRRCGGGAGRFLAAAGGQGQGDGEGQQQQAWGGGAQGSLRIGGRRRRPRRRRFGRTVRLRPAACGCRRSCAGPPASARSGS